MILKRVCIAAGIATMAASAAPARAEPAPLLVPQRDVTIAYRVIPGGHDPIDVRVAIKAGGSRLRITSDTLPTTLLVNRDTEKAAIVLPMLRAYSDIKIGRYDPEQTVLKGATFTRLGHDTVAGRGCTVWQAQSSDGEASACITADGVILRGMVASNKGDDDKRGHGRRGATITATQVIFGPVPDAEFEIPPDFARSPFKLSLNGLGK